MKDLVAQFQREQLHGAAGAGDLARVDALIERGYPVNRFDSLGWTPLHHAVRGEHFNVVDRLLAAGANVNANDERQIGDTPLADCVETCTYEMAKRLIDAGADPTIPGWMQLTAVHRAEVRKDVNARKIRRLLHDTVARRATSVTPTSQALPPDAP